MSYLEHCDLPFMGIDDNCFQQLFNLGCLCHGRVTNNYSIDDLPRFEILSKLDKIPNHLDLDTESYFSVGVNFNYYTPHDFHSNQEINRMNNKSLFSTIHCNIRSLQKNYDKLCNLLADLNYCFNIIGLSETKRKDDADQITCNSIPGYEFVSSPTMTNAGGVGFFINENINYKIRDEFTQITLDYEYLWIEIDCGPHKNIICGVLYRHPTSKLENSLVICLSS